MRTSFLCLTVLLALTMKGHYYFDTGASFHMTGDVSSLSDVYGLVPPVKVNTASGIVWCEYAGTSHFLQIKGYEGPISLQEVVYNPHLKDVSLISWGQIMHKCKLVHDSNDTMSIYSKRDGRLMLQVTRNASNVFPAGWSISVPDVETQKTNSMQ
jgi:hypothetical protein